MQRFPRGSWARRRSEFIAKFRAKHWRPDQPRAMSMSPLLLFIFSLYAPWISLRESARSLRGRMEVKNQSKHASRIRVRLLAPMFVRFSMCGGRRIRMPGVFYLWEIFRHNAFLFINERIPLPRQQHSRVWFIPADNRILLRKSTDNLRIH